LPKGKVGPLAQLVEQRTFNPWVDGSSPSGPTVSLTRLLGTRFPKLLQTQLEKQIS
jgi:hypothetical protein